MSKSKVAVIEALTGPIALVSALITIVLLSVFAEGRHVTELLAFMGGVLVPMRYRGGSGGGGGAAGAAVLAVVLLSTGCGAGAVGVHGRAATVLAVAGQGASRAVREASMANYEMTCPRAEYSGADRAAAAEACVAPVRDRWRDADAAIAAVRASILSYIEVLRVADVAESGEDVERALAIALARVIGDWNDMLAVLRERDDVDIPELPVWVLDLIRVIGGE